MNDPIYKELRSKVSIPPMTIDTTFVSKVDTSILRHRSTKQVIKLTAKEVKEILEEKEINLPEFLLKFDDGFSESDVSQYSNMTDGYQVSEYFSNTDMYIPTFDYFRAVKFGNIDCIINIYNGKNCKIPFRQVLDKIKVESESDINVYDLVLPWPIIKDNIKWVKFTDTLYNEKTRINKYMYKFPSLCVNLPYEYFKDQSVPENIFVWNVDRKEFEFAGKSSDEVLLLFEEICNNGLTTPLYFQISHGNIVSASDEDYIKLIIAQYLKIPTIPAVLYVLKNDIKTDMLTSMRPCDIITSYSFNYTATKEEYDLINKVCSPYIIFYNSNYAEPVAMADNDDVVLEEYMGPVYNQIENSSQDIIFNEFYLVKESDDKDEFNNVSAEELHTIMLADLQKQINKDIATALKVFDSIT